MAVALPNIVNTVVYTLPTSTASGNPGTDQINATGVLAKGTFSVEYTYNSSGVYQSAQILSSNITTSGGSSGNTVYNNTFSQASTNTFDALGYKDGTTGSSTPAGDHVGASISFTPSDGSLSVKFQELQGNTDGANGKSLYSDYNQLDFTFIDTAAKDGKDSDLYTTSRTVTISDFTEHYDRLSPGNTTVNSSISDSGGTDDTMTAACYCKGTFIMTSTGEVAVCELSVGDQVLTVSGAFEPVIWLGNSTINCERQLHQDKAYPVRIVKDAFGINLPTRDLFLSPDHSVYIDGVMIPAYCLINGTTITQERTETLVTYYHVELPQHQAILAEGLPAESYLETSEENRHFFKEATAGATSNVTKIDNQYPVCPENTPAWRHIWDTQGFAPLTQSGPILEIVQAKLAVLSQELSAKKALQAA
jgi:Hint domain